MGLEAENVMDSVMEKLKELRDWLFYFFQLCHSRERKMGLEAENVMDSVMEKLKELLLCLENIGESLLHKFNDLFPPETRDEKLHQWLKIGAPFLIGGIFLILLCYCCGRCCCGRRTRMMVAPGRRPLRVPRNVFERNPRSYFRNLRAK